MSIFRLELSVFRFDCKKDYSPSYEKCSLEYTEDFLLSDVLKSLPLRDFEYDKNISLKINNIAVFQNSNVIDLVEHFGKEWTLEPISIKYAYKDLTINKEAILSFYQSFLEGGDFLSPEELSEISKFIDINFISPQKNPEYFGDGFFLYVKWLLLRHPDKTKRLLESIGDINNGVMNFVSVTDFVYPKNSQIDAEIFEIQKMLTHGLRCPITSSTWAKFSKNIEEKYHIPAQTPTSKKSSSKEVYAIFNGYEKNWNFKPLLVSVSTLMDKMDLDVLDLDFCFDGGYWGRFCNQEKFLFANAYNMALAYKNNAVLLLCDEDSYANVLYAKEIIDSSQDLKQDLNEKLSSYGLIYEPQVQIKYLNEMIAKDLKWSVSRDFKGFSSVLFGGSFASSVPKFCYKDLFEKVSLKLYQTGIQNQSYAHLFDFNPESALIQSGAIRYEAIDLGADFLISASLAQFEMFDTHAKKSSRLYKRDFDPVPSLFLPQVALISMGEKDSKKIGLHLHKNKVNFI